MKIERTTLIEPGGDWRAFVRDDTGHVIFKIYGATKPECDARKFWLAHVAGLDNLALSVAFESHCDRAMFDAWQLAHTPGRIAS